MRTKAPERGPAELPTCYRYSFTCYKAIAKDLNDLILAFNACSGHSHNQQQDFVLTVEKSSSSRKVTNLIKDM